MSDAVDSPTEPTVDSCRPQTVLSLVVSRQRRKIKRLFGVVPATLTFLAVVTTTAAGLCMAYVAEVRRREMNAEYLRARELAKSRKVEARAENEPFENHGTRQRIAIH